MKTNKSLGKKLEKVFILEMWLAASLGVVNINERGFKNRGNQTPCKLRPPRDDQIFFDPPRDACNFFNPPRAPIKRLNGMYPIRDLSNSYVVG